MALEEFDFRNGGGSHSFLDPISMVAVSERGGVAFYFTEIREEVEGER